MIETLEFSRKFTMEALSRLSREDQISLVPHLRERARRQLLPFTLWTKPDYRAGWFHHVVAHELDKFLDDVVNQRSPRLMLFAPPRHGKSELVSRRFPAFALGRHPTLSIIATSHGSDLASAMNRDVQRVIDSPEYYELFPNTTLSQSSVRTVTAGGSYLRNSEIFEVVGSTGVYKSAGVGTSITGRGGHILIIDDPVKDAQEANSPVTRDSIWSWYTSTLYTRQMPGAGILLIQTRWHGDDLGGRLLSKMQKGGEQWRVVKFPAIAEEDEEFRKAGEPLHPERYSLEMLEKIRVGTADEIGVGSRVWAALYQQRPSDKEGTIFKRDAWSFYRTTTGKRWADMTSSERRDQLQALGVETVIQYWDTAAGGRQHNDYSACVTLGVGKNRYIGLDLWKQKAEFPDVKRAVKLQFEKWNPSRVDVEGGGSISGKSIIQELKRETRIPFREITHSTDKVLRANVIAPTHEAGLCWLPEMESWTSDFVDSCANFPYSDDGDDDVDAWMGAMESAINRKQAMTIPDSLLESL